MKTKNQEFITLEQAFKRAFAAGMLLGIELGGLASRMAPLVRGKEEKEIQRILRVELKNIFQKVRKETAAVG